MLRQVILSAAVVALAAPALAEEVQKPAAPTAAAVQTTAPATAAATPAKGTKLHRTSSGYQGCNWASKAKPIS